MGPLHASWPSPCMGACKGICTHWLPAVHLSLAQQPSTSNRSSPPPFPLHGETPPEGALHGGTFFLQKLSRCQMQAQGHRVWLYRGNRGLQKMVSQEKIETCSTPLGPPKSPPGGSCYIRARRLSHKSLISPRADSTTPESQTLFHRNPAAPSSLPGCALRPHCTLPHQATLLPSSQNKLQNLRSRALRPTAEACSVEKQGRALFAPPAWSAGPWGHSGRHMRPQGRGCWSKSGPHVLLVGPWGTAVPHQQWRQTLCQTAPWKRIFLARKTVLTVCPMHKGRVGKCVGRPSLSRCCD